MEKERTKVNESETCGMISGSSISEVANIKDMKRTFYEEGENKKQIKRTGTP